MMANKFQLKLNAFATIQHYTRCVFQDSKPGLLLDTEPPAIMPHDADLLLVFSDLYGKAQKTCMLSGIAAGSRRGIRECCPD